MPLGYDPCDFGATCRPRPACTPCRCLPMACRPRSLRQPPILLPLGGETSVPAREHRSAPNCQCPGVTQLRRPPLSGRLPDPPLPIRSRMAPGSDASRSRTGALDPYRTPMSPKCRVASCRSSAPDQDVAKDPPTSVGADGSHRGTRIPRRTWRSSERRSSTRTSLARPRRSPPPSRRARTSRSLTR